MLLSAGRSVLLCLALTASICAESRAQLPLSPLSDFTSLSETQLAGTQVRFTFVGEHSGRGLPSIGFTTTGGTLDLAGFVPYYRSEFPYDGDDGVVARFTVSPAELKALVDSVSTLAGVSDGGVDPGGYLEFGLYCVVEGQPRCFASVLDKANGTDLFSKILAAIAANAEGVRLLAQHACALGMLGRQEPVIVDDRVSIVVRGLRRQRGTNEYVGKIRLTNTSATSLEVPLAAALEPPLGATLIAPAGYTCVIQPGGVPFVRFPAASSLGPGQSTEVVVRLLNPARSRVELKRIRAFVDSGGH